ncbi:NAD-glutamate dehydrogenase [Sphingobium sufflavum]|uniref:NAD-glutamate dehydrogenase domain-containing protein n=1 Tax=Sphingobium sufflavum TaxID=1129547 RepID=UPI001F33FB66|nr:NAD-glutamate dehydrogenase domain-containing protein [Sphingobium sufflavum]MCE7795491.1 NAD-glutamate dehydrogenase [Sphingobium sufflavum]
MDARHDSSRAVSAALATAIEDSLARTEPGLLNGARLKAASLFLGEAMRDRRPGQPIIQVDTGGEAEDQPGPDAARRMRFAIINDDMPFLVDSISGCIVAAGLAVHIIVHPVLPVRRTDAGHLIAIGEGEKAHRESIIYIEADHADARSRHAVEASLHQTLDQLRAAVTDWRPMIAAMLDDANTLGEGDEGDLLRWFLKGNLTQLGHERRTRAGKVQGPLGICRTADEPLLAPATLDAAFDWFDAGNAGPLILKSNRCSRIHRQVLVDVFIVPVRGSVKGKSKTKDKDGEAVTALSIHAGLWTSAALAAAPSDVPILRTTLDRLMTRFGFDPVGHAGKGLVHALTYLPHDILLGLSPADREHLAFTALSLGDRPRAEVELAAGALQRHLFGFVWLPRDEMTTARREAIGQMLSTASNAPVLSWSMALDESGLALLRFVIDLRDEGVIPDDTALDARLAEMVRGWTPAVEAALAVTVEARRAAVLARRYAHGFPMGYREGAGAEQAATDILRLHRLPKVGARDARLYRNPGDTEGHLRLKLYSLDSITLSDAVPALENFGFRVIEELITSLGEGGELGHIQKLVLALDSEALAKAVLKRADTIERVIASVLEGHGENDRFNDLLLSAGLEPDGVILLRAIFRYLRQTGSAYGLSTVVAALRRAPKITGDLVALFAALHDPALERGKKADGLAARIETRIEEALAAVAAIDDDRILRLIRSVMQAVLRTNAFTPAGQGALAFKIDSALVPGLPSPVPWREIWVYSPRVEGIHLRAGPIARGGLRWSDRRDDFRTEVLGLMKAQRVKNAVIVPTGAKGGFLPKQLPDPAANRDAWLAEGTESYRIFIRALLSVTDNVVKGKVKHPRGMVIRDGDDPYFVVAADKGTASFSDIANSIALEHGFWLGDAFASGGSNGYDHKAMGITARGGWLSVQRHFLEMGVDVQADPVSVVGVGDMSGDVFGNGMLLSKAIRLVAAFDHRHIFIDPDPDTAKAHAERARLFALPRSSWDDYDKALISKGGGVFPRTLKSIPLSPEMQAIIGTAAVAMDPAALISALLTADVDLIWFGGIGTYIKAVAQSNAEVGDTANDRVRVDAESIRAKVIGEGANMGVTQAARIAYALGGGRINTDFIDNSAGVDCSDNEVNIKIALARDVTDGSLTPDARNKLLAKMTDSVARLVLEDNRLQALGLSIAEAGGAADIPAYVRLIDGLVRSGRLDRKVEGLPGDPELMRRAQEGHGLTRPELAVLLATAKLSLQDAIEHNHLPDDPITRPDLFNAFPPEMQKKHKAAIEQHQLRREIVATEVANRIVNRIGIIPPLMLGEDEGFTLSDVAAAFIVAETLFDLPAIWASADTAQMPETVRIAYFRRLSDAVTDHIRELCRLSAGTLSPSETLDMVRPGVAKLLPRATAPEAEAALVEQGVPADLAAALARLEQAMGAAGIAELARRRGDDAVAVADAAQDVSTALGLDWLQLAASHLAPVDPWERLLIAGVERDIQEMRLLFLARADKGGLRDHVGQWLERHEAALTQYRILLTRARAGSPSAAMLAEVVARARALLHRA